MQTDRPLQCNSNLLYMNCVCFSTGVFHLKPCSHHRIIHFQSDWFSSMSIQLSAVWPMIIAFMLVVNNTVYWFRNFHLQIRFVTDEFICPVIMHCHILNQEDLGMMMVVNIVPPGSLLGIHASTVSANQD